MNRSIYTYALIRSMYNKEGDYIDSFWPFALKILSTFQRPINIDELKEALKKTFSLDIPLYVLRTILKRAKNKGYLDDNGNKYNITEKGIDYVGKLEDERDIERRINSVIQDLGTFLQKRGVVLKQDQIYTLLTSFIEKNLESMVEFINPSAKIRFNIANIQQYESILIKYLNEIEKAKPEAYSTIKELIYGSIISTVLYTPESANITEVNRRFKDCTIYLDSNIALYVLGLQSAEFSVPAQELLDLLRKSGVTIKIFNSTLDQVRRVIYGYGKEYDKYIPNLNVDTIYSNLRNMGWDPTDVTVYLQKLNNELNKLGITIEDDDFNIDPNQRIQSVLFEKLYEFKKDEKEPSIAGLNHDLLVIEAIRRKRRHSVYSIEESKVLFLTADVKLNYFDYLEYGHKDKGSVAEVILDRILANIIWLKNPNAELPIKSIIATHSKSLFIKKAIWDKFYEILKKLRKENKVSDEQISLLIYHSKLQENLERIHESEGAKVNDSFVMSQIAEANKNIENKIIGKTEEVKSDFIRKLEESESEKAKMELEIKGKLQEIETKIRFSAKKQSKLYSWIIMILFILLLVLIFRWLIWEKRYITPNILNIIITYGGISIVTILGWFLKARPRLENYLYKKIYNNKIKLIR